MMNIWNPWEIEREIWDEEEETKALDSNSTRPSTQLGQVGSDLPEL